MLHPGSTSLTKEGDMDRERFKKLLDDHHTWPGLYTFKFIVPSSQLEELQKLFSKEKRILKPSANGTYTSLTATGIYESSDKVDFIYQSACKIEKIIML